MASIGGSIDTLPCQGPASLAELGSIRGHETPYNDDLSAAHMAGKVADIRMPGRGTPSIMELISDIHIQEGKRPVNHLACMRN